MKKRLEAFIIFMFVCLCYCIIILDKHLEKKMQEKSFLNLINTNFESYEEFYNLFNDKEYYEFYQRLPIFFSNTNKKMYKLVIDKRLEYSDRNRYSLQPCYQGIEKIKNMFDMFYYSRKEDCSSLNNVNYDEISEKSYKSIIEESKKKCNEILNDAILCASKFEVDNKVYNYKEYLAFHFNDNNVLLNVEIYDKKNIFNSKTEMNNFLEIEKEYGNGRKGIYNYKNYKFYSLMYRYENLIISFFSYYKDGSNNICIVYPSYYND